MSDQSRVRSARSWRPGLLCTLLVLLLANATAGAEAPREVIYYFPDSVGRDLTAVASYYQTYLDAVVGPALGWQLKVRYFNRLHDLEAFVEQCRADGGGRLAFAVLHAEVALEKRHQWGLEMIGYVVAASGRPTHQISVVVRRNSDIRRLEDLRGKRVMAPEYWGRNKARFERKALAGRLRLDELAGVELATSSISALMGLSFRQVDAAIVSDRVFEVLKDRSAAIWRSLSRLHSSEPLPIAAWVFFDTGPRWAYEILRREGVRIHESPEGRRWFDYTRMSHGVAGEWTDLYAEADLASSLPPRKSE